MAVHENDFRETVRQYAELHGWDVKFTWNSKHSPAGEADLRMVRSGRYVVVELKMPGETPTIAQLLTLYLLQEVPGIEVYVWWFGEDWALIEEVLA